MKAQNDTEEMVAKLAGVIEAEKADGCCMADALLIKPAIRRWLGYERRNQRSKDKSLQHRTLDLKKGLLALFPDYSYDEACITHLAESFAVVLNELSSHDSAHSTNTGDECDESSHPS